MYQDKKELVQRTSSGGGFTPSNPPGTSRAGWAAYLLAGVALSEKNKFLSLTATRIFKSNHVKGCPSTLGVCPLTFIYLYWASPPAYINNKSKLIITYQVIFFEKIANKNGTSLFAVSKASAVFLFQ